MTKMLRLLAMLTTSSTLALPSLRRPPAFFAITTPDKVVLRLGTLEFKNGVPDAATLAKLYDNLDYTHAFNAFDEHNARRQYSRFPQGTSCIRVKDNEVIIFSELMDFKVAVPHSQCGYPRFGILDLSKGPMVLLRHPQITLAPSYDQWFRWVIYIGQDWQPPLWRKVENTLQLAA